MNHIRQGCEMNSIVQPSSRAVITYFKICAAQKRAAFSLANLKNDCKFEEFNETFVGTADKTRYCIKRIVEGSLYLLETHRWFMQTFLLKGNRWRWWSDLSNVEWFCTFSNGHFQNRKTFSYISGCLQLRSKCMLSVFSRRVGKWHNLV